MPHPVNSPWLHVCQLALLCSKRAPGLDKYLLKIGAIWLCYCSSSALSPELPLIWALTLWMQAVLVSFTGPLLASIRHR